jgi:hypothetical protein
MFVINFQGSEINLTFQHGMRDFIVNGKHVKEAEVSAFSLVLIILVRGIF